MKLIGITYKNTVIDDEVTFRALPEVLQKFLNQVNGIIAYKGGIHFRGCCIEPKWHSIQEAWTGKWAFWKNYPDVLDIDIPFAQDCMGDQYLLRGNKVIKLSTETGEIDFLNLDFIGFLDEIEKDPMSFLSMQPLVQFEMEGKQLEPGKLLSAYPPFCLNNSGLGVTLSDVPVEERLNFLADLSKKVRNMNDGEDVQFIVE